MWHETHAQEICATNAATHSAAEIRTAYKLDERRGGDPRRPRGTATKEVEMIGQSFPCVMVTVRWPALSGSAHPRRFALQEMLAGYQADWEHMGHRPLWLLAAGMGNEIPALAAMRVKVNAIYAAEREQLSTIVLQAQVRVPQRVRTYEGGRAGGDVG